MKSIIAFLTMFLLTGSCFSQNAGIGTSTPVTKLQVNGSVSNPAIPGVSSNAIFRIGFGANGGMDIGVTSSFPTAPWFQAGFGGVSAAPIIFQPLGGNVGIGTSNPLKPLEVNGDGGIQITNGANGSASNELFFSDNGQIRSLDNFHRIVFNRSNDQMEFNEFGKILFKTGNPLTEVMRINNSNVGIGTTTPSNKLSVAGTSDIQVLGVGTTTPASSAVLDASSTTKGFLPPRMTNVQRDAISGPVTGLLVFCTNCGLNGGELEVYSGGMWRNMIGNTAAGTAIGQSYQGGIIAYILQPGDPGYDANGWHGLIAAPTDQSTLIQWENPSYVTTGATGTAIGTGNSNTNTIVSVLGAGGFAAKLCYDLVLNGYSDWYLPSKDELNMLYNNKSLVGGFASNLYWSSTESGTDTAWTQDFGNGAQVTTAKGSLSIHVRAVRAF